jgi:ABC-type dipeptide/oligopeptide/nickel transport system ATPase subunit
VSRSSRARIAVDGIEFDPITQAEVVERIEAVQQPQAQAVNPHMSLRDNIRQMVTPGEEDPMQGLGLNQGQHPSQQYVILPDGTRAPLRQG